MKTIQLILLLCLIGLEISCTPDRDRPPIPRTQAAEATPVAPPSVSSSVDKAVRQKGDAIAAEAFGVLSSRLGKAIAEAGYTNAIDFCSVHGIQLTAKVGITNDVVLRRVTHRARNPQNQADTNELAIIRQFETELSRGAHPKAVVAATKPGLITYYTPIVLNSQMCLQCHGEPGTDIQADVLTSIRRKYPADQAIHFKQGQVRGLWSVDFKRTDFETQ